MKNLIRKFIFNEKIEYLFWGAMTTLVYFIARLMSMAMTTSNMIPVGIAQVISIIFAFIVNKYLVFNGTQSKNVMAQFIIFIIGRLMGAILDVLVTIIMISKYYNFFIHIFLLNRIHYDVWPFSIEIVNKLMGSPVLMNKIICVVFIQILLIVVNYIVSKYFAFK